MENVLLKRNVPIFILFIIITYVSLKYVNIIISKYQNDSIITAIQAYEKGERDCRSLWSRYLELAAKERDLSNKSVIQDEKIFHIRNYEYYNKMADDSYRIAESNAVMAQTLKAKTKRDVQGDGGPRKKRGGNAFW